MFFHNALPFFLLTLISLSGCSQKDRIATKGTLQMKTQLYNKDGKPTFTHYLKIWHKDSLVIEEITGVNTVMTSKDTTTTFPLIGYKFIDPRSRTIYDYKTFSDTSRIVKTFPLTDSLMDGPGWNIYSEKAPAIGGESIALKDTFIENVNYKRYKCNFKWDNPEKVYLIGYFNCDNKDCMFSLEKFYSRKIQCPMVKFFSYRTSKTTPYGSMEVFYLSDTLSPEDIKVFDAWERNARNNPAQ